MLYGADMEENLQNEIFRNAREKMRTMLLLFQDVREWHPALALHLLIKKQKEKEYDKFAKGPKESHRGNYRVDKQDVWTNVKEIGNTCYFRMT